MYETPLSAFKMTGTRIDAFIGEGITDVVIPDGVTEIKREAFVTVKDSVKDNIQSVFIPDSVMVIGESAFEQSVSAYPERLKKVRLPKNLKKLEHGTFAMCKNLQEIHLPHGLQFIGIGAFSGSGIAQLVIPSSVIRLGGHAFERCASLWRVYIPDTLQFIGMEAFKDCRRLTVYTTAGSYAEEYARKHGIPVSIISEKDMEAEQLKARIAYLEESASWEANIVRQPAPAPARPAPAPVRPAPTRPAPAPARPNAQKERIFFIINIHSQGRFFLGEDNYFGSGTSGSNIYGDFRFCDIVLRRKGLFREEKLLPIDYILYAYEEDGVFYEFFSGRMIGRRKPSGIERNGYILTSFADFGTLDYTIRRLTAAEFAEKIKPFVPYKDHMSSEMSKLLDAIDRQYKRLRDAANAKKNAENRTERNSRSWLDSMIDGN